MEQNLFFSVIFAQNSLSLKQLNGFEREQAHCLRVHSFELNTLEEKVRLSNELMMMIMQSAWDA